MSMERFNLSRYDLMCMSWSEVVMLFEATYDDDHDKGRDDDIIDATPEMYERWA